MTDQVTIRHDLRPGDLGTVIHLHGVHYAREWQLDTTFEPYVAAPLADFVLKGPDAGRLWLAELNSEVVGSIALVKTDSGEGQLRWFLLTPGGRDRGLGQQLIGHTLNYARDQGLRHVFLWTFDGLAAAQHLYRKAGFRETQRTTQSLWGRNLVEIRMDLDLSPK
jgi:GNAT superfamily N-acetyltransferase